MNIFVFKLNQLGDNVVFLPVVRQLRESFPHGRITILASPPLAPWYRSIGDGIRVLTCEQLRFNSSWKRPWELAWWLTKIRAEKPDACFLSFDQGNVSHLIAKYSGADIRVGSPMRFVKVKGSLTHPCPFDPTKKTVEQNWSMGMSLARALGAREWPAKPPVPVLGAACNPAPIQRTVRIVVHAGSNQPITRWPLERFAELAARLSLNHEVIWIDRPETSGVAIPAWVHREDPRDLSRLVDLLAGADLFIGNNSGPMHIANSVGMAGLVIAGPSAPAWDPYWFSERWEVLRHPTLTCVGCETKTLWNRRCENGVKRECLDYWTVDKVEERCRALIARRCLVRPLS